MLDAETRLLIAPRLAAFRRTTHDLEANRRQLAETAAKLAEHPAARGVFSGLLSQDGATARGLRDLRRDQKKLAATIGDQEAHAERLAKQIDDVLHPALQLKDLPYQQLVMATQLFRQAVGHCDTASAHLDGASGAASTVSKALTGKVSGPSEQFQTELAARRYDDCIRDAERAVVALPDKIAHIQREVGNLVRGVLPPVPMPDCGLFDALPRTLSNTGARLRIADALNPLRALQQQLRTTTTAVKQRLELADKKRRAALRAAYSRI